MIDETDLKAMAFKKSGVLRTNTKGQFQFDGQEATRNAVPGVYLWVRRGENERTLDVMYAGKAGNGLVARMAQHIGGLKSADAARIDRIKTAFGLGECLEVWFRQSDKISVNALYDKQISAYSTEEEALITRFSPPLNRAKTPAMRAVSRESSYASAEAQVFTAINSELISANGTQRDLWEDALTGISESHKRKIGRILVSLDKLPGLQGKWPAPDFKIVGYYTAGPLCNQTMLVFGEIAQTNFKKDSRVVYVSLEKELIAFSSEVMQGMPMAPDVDGAYSLDACLRMLNG